MAFIRCLCTAVIAFCFAIAKGQTVYYPFASSQMLKSTAEDVASLFTKAIPGSQFTAQSFNTVPVSGIIFIYDSTIAGNQSCKVESNGSTYIKFFAREDNGLCFGVYQYLQQLGFRFYQPGTIWEITPTLSSPYKIINTTFTSSFKYKGWFISGGCNRWAMDNDNNYGWDTYFGENGHNWALYQRRNGMMGEYRFAGHRSDVMTGTYLNTLQNNPCYIACYDGSRTASVNSVADINNTAAMQLWANTIEGKYTHYKNTIYGNTSLYANQYRNFSYYNNLIGIEVPDGAQWGNTADNAVCNGNSYPKESDQHFILSNTTVQKISTQLPGKQFQVYAYSKHADVPSANIVVSNNIDVQVIPTAFQNETSAKGLLNRWYSRTGNVSEYHYMNISQWGGETPMFFWNETKTTLQRLKEKNSQGIIWEASPAKFASLPFLLAANSNLTNNADTDSVLNDFCTKMFGNAAVTINKLLTYWGSDKTISTGTFIQDNKYKLPFYFQLVNDAIQQTQNDAAVVKQRISELKAYMHYMVLYYDWLFDQRSNEAKQDKAAALCIYLAKINKLQIVNSYFLIADITSRYNVSSAFYQLYNVSSGTAYNNGNLPLITTTEIENNYEADNAAYTNLINQHVFETAAAIKEKFTQAGLSTTKKITFKLSYTNGTDYSNRSEFYIDAAVAGSFSIKYFIQYQMPEKGYMNFTVESVEKPLQIQKDFSITRNDAPDGILTINLPSAGTYKLSFVSKCKTTADVTITTNGNYFYKNGAFLGNKTENYRSSLVSLPGYFYIPAGMSKIYFSVNNSNPGGGGFATAADVSKAFVFKDNSDNTIQPKLANTNDSALFYLDIPAGSSGTFFRVFKMEQYNLCFANISNITWCAERKACSNANFTAAVIKKYGTCVTQLTAAANSNNLQWEIYDLNKWTYYSNQQVIELPITASPNAVVALHNGNRCSVTKRLGDDDKYLKAKEACASGAPIAENKTAPVVYPNPSNGIFNCMLNGAVFTADEIIVTNSQGLQVTSLKNAKQFNIANAPAGTYWYRMAINGEIFRGKIIKL